MSHIQTIIFRNKIRIKNVLSLSKEKRKNRALLKLLELKKLGEQIMTQISRIKMIQFNFFFYIYIKTLKAHTNSP